MFFKNKQEIEIAAFCGHFYDNFILNPGIEQLDFGQVYADVVKNKIVEADNNFASIDPKTLNNELQILHFEIFGLAWLHQFGEIPAIAQSIFTRSYLHEKNRDDIWDGTNSYNQAIARSSTLGKTPKKPFDRVFLARVNETRAGLFYKYCHEVEDPTCIGRAVNRLFADEAWKKEITHGLLMFALCDRLGFDSNFQPSKGAQFVIGGAIQGMYKGARQSIEKTIVKDVNSFLKI